MEPSDGNNDKEQPTRVPATISTTIEGTPNKPNTTVKTLSLPATRSSTTRSKDDAEESEEAVSSEQRQKNEKEAETFTKSLATTKPKVSTDLERYYTNPPPDNFAVMAKDGTRKSYGSNQTELMAKDQAECLKEWKKEKVKFWANDKKVKEKEEKERQKLAKNIKNEEEKKEREEKKEEEKLRKEREKREREQKKKKVGGNKFDPEPENEKELKWELSELRTKRTLTESTGTYTVPKGRDYFFKPKKEGNAGHKKDISRKVTLEGQDEDETSTRSEYSSSGNSEQSSRRKRAFLRTDGLHMEGGGKETSGFAPMAGVTGRLSVEEFLKESAATGVEKLEAWKRQQKDTKGPRPRTPGEGGSGWTAEWQRKIRSGSLGKQREDRSDGNESSDEDGDEEDSREFKPARDKRGDKEERERGQSRTPEWSSEAREQILTFNGAPSEVFPLLHNLQRQLGDKLYHDNGQRLFRTTLGEGPMKFVMVPHDTAEEMDDWAMQQYKAGLRKYSNHVRVQGGVKFDRCEGVVIVPERDDMHGIPPSLVSVTELQLFFVAEALEEKYPHLGYLRPFQTKYPIENESTLYTFTEESSDKSDDRGSAWFSTQLEDLNPPFDEKLEESLYKKPAFPISRVCLETGLNTVGAANAHNWNAEARRLFAVGCGMDKFAPAELLAESMYWYVMVALSLPLSNFNMVTLGRKGTGRVISPIATALLAYRMTLSACPGLNHELNPRHDNRSYESIADWKCQRNADERGPKGFDDNVQAVSLNLREQFMSAEGVRNRWIERTLMATEEDNVPTPAMNATITMLLKTTADYEIRPDVALNLFGYGNDEQIRMAGMLSSQSNTNDTNYAKRGHTKKAFKAMASNFKHASWTLGKDDAGNPEEMTPSIKHLTRQAAKTHIQLMRTSGCANFFQFARAQFETERTAPGALARTYADLAVALIMNQCFKKPMNDYIGLLPPQGFLDVMTALGVPCMYKDKQTTRHIEDVKQVTAVVIAKSRDFDYELRRELLLTLNPNSKELSNESPHLEEILIRDVFKSVATDDLVSESGRVKSRKEKATSIAATAEKKKPQNRRPDTEAYGYRVKEDPPSAQGYLDRDSSEESDGGHARLRLSPPQEDRLLKTGRFDEDRGERTGGATPKAKKTGRGLGDGDIDGEPSSYLAQLLRGNRPRPPPAKTQHSQENDKKSVSIRELWAARVKTQRHERGKEPRSNNGVMMDKATHCPDPSMTLGQICYTLDFPKTGDDYRLLRRDLTDGTIVAVDLANTYSILVFKVVAVNNKRIKLAQQHDDQRQISTTRTSGRQPDDSDERLPLVIVAPADATLVVDLPFTLRNVARKRHDKPRTTESDEDSEDSDNQDNDGTRRRKDRGGERDRGGDRPLPPRDVSRRNDEQSGRDTKKADQRDQHSSNKRHRVIPAETDSDKEGRGNKQQSTYRIEHDDGSVWRQELMLREKRQANRLETRTDKQTDRRPQPLAERRNRRKERDWSDDEDSVEDPFISPETMVPKDVVFLANGEWVKVNRVAKQQKDYDANKLALSAGPQTRNKETGINTGNYNNVLFHSEVLNEMVKEKGASYVREIMTTNIMTALREAQMGIGKGARNFNWASTDEVVTSGEVQSWTDYATSKVKKQRFLSRDDVEELVTFISVVSGALFGNAVKKAFEPLIARVKDTSNVKFSLFHGKYTMSMVNDGLAEAKRQTLKFIKTKEANETSTAMFLAEAIENGFEQHVKHSNEGQMMYLALQKHIKANAAVFNMGADAEDGTSRNKKSKKKRDRDDGSSDDDEVSDAEPDREAKRRLKDKARKERKKTAKALAKSGTKPTIPATTSTTTPKGTGQGKNGNKNQTSSTRGTGNSGHDCFNHALFLLGERNRDCQYGTNCTSHHATAKDPYKATSINADAKKFRKDDNAAIVKIKSALEKKITEKDPLFTT